MTNPRILTPAEYVAEFGGHVDDLALDGIVAPKLHTYSDGTYVVEVDDGTFWLMLGNEEWTATTREELEPRLVDWVRSEWVEFDTPEARHDADPMTEIVARKLTTADEADAWIRDLVNNRHDFHFDDDPSDLVAFHGGAFLFLPSEIDAIAARVSEIESLLSDPFENLLSHTRRRDGEPEPESNE